MYSWQTMLVYSSPPQQKMALRSCVCFFLGSTLFSSKEIKQGSLNYPFFGGYQANIWQFVEGFLFIILHWFGLVILNKTPLVFIHKKLPSPKSIQIHEPPRSGGGFSNKFSCLETFPSTWKRWRLAMGRRSIANVQKPWMLKLHTERVKAGSSLKTLRGDRKAPRPGGLLGIPLPNGWWIAYKWGWS